MLALQTYRRYLKRFPDHEQIGKAQEAVTLLETELPSMLATFGVSGDEGFALAVQHDEIRVAVETKQLQEARRAANKLLKQYPDFAPALNNLSQVDFMEGRVEQAIALAERVLAFDPNNFQALGNLARYQFLSGRREAAQATAARLKLVESDNADIWLKKIEALTHLGDDAGVLETFEAAKQGGYPEEVFPNALIYHLAAVAALRLGDEKQARQLWRDCLRLDPNFSLAQENLDDLSQPIGDRHAPWPYSFAQWVSQRTIEDFAKRMAPAARQGADRALERVAQRFLKQHSHVVTLAPILLERGDPQAREFVINLSQISKAPELLAALPDFAMSQNGPDALRMQAAQFALRAGLLPSKQVQMWMRGQRQEVMLMGFEIYEEPDEPTYSPEVMELAQAAFDAMHEDDPETAEELLLRARELQPNAPELMNNLAMAYQMMGREKEATDLLREINRQHPDYFFGIVGMANLHTQQGEYDQAHEMLKPLLLQDRLHLSEFRAVCQAQIQLLLAEDNVDGAAAWLYMWQDVEPDYPDLRTWQMRLAMKDNAFMKTLRGLGNILRR
jgi:tetratricopeptide (TPR) repeat protein